MICIRDTRVPCKKDILPQKSLALSEDLLTSFGGGPSAFDDPGDPAIGAAAMLFTKIGDGPLDLATVSLSSADDATLVDLTFTAAGLTYLNTIKGGGKKILLGGALLSVTGGGGVTEQPFGGTGPDIDGMTGDLPTLSFTVVPEPGASSLLAGLSVLLVCVSRRRR